MRISATPLTLFVTCLMVVPHGQQALAQSNVAAFHATSGPDAAVPPRLRPVDIVITHWSPREAREQLLKGFKTSQRGAADVLLRLGIVGRVTWSRLRPDDISEMTRDFHYAESVTLGNGRRQIVLIAGRPPLKKGQSNPAENITRASEYPISAIELTVGPDGVGRGKSHDVARIKSIGKDGFVFEDYAGRPIELMDVKPR